MIRKSTLSTLLAVICACSLFIGTSYAQFPHTVSYQGIITDGTAPIVGPVDITVNYYNAATNVLLYTETFSSVPTYKGTFALELGSLNAAVGTLFDAATPIEIGVRVNGGSEMQPRTKLSGAPYAFTAYSLLGIPASLTPMNNTFFPLPVDGEGHIGTSVLPTATINGLPIYDNNVRVVAGRNMTVTANTSTGTLTIDGPATPTITSIVGAAGINSSQTNGTVSLSTNADPNQFGYINNALHIRSDIPVFGTDAHFRSLVVDNDGYFGGGVISYGLQTGNLVTSDAATIGGNLYLLRNLYATNDELSIHAASVLFNQADVSELNTIQVNGRSTFATLGGNVGIGTNAPNNLLDMQTHSEAPAVASLSNAWGDAFVRLTGHDNHATGLQMNSDYEYGGAILTSPVTGMDFHMVTPDQVTEETFVPTPSDLTLMRLGWNNNIEFYANTLDFTGNRLQNVGTPTSGMDAANKDYVDNGAALSGDLHGTITDNSLNPNNDGIGDRMIDGINRSYHQIFGWRVWPNFDHMPLTAGLGMMSTLHLFDGYGVRDFNPENDVSTESIDGRPGKALVIHRGSIEAVAPNSQSGNAPDITSDRFADMVSASGTTVTISNSLVRTNSVIILTLEVPGGNFLSMRSMMITDKQDGQFTVRTTLPFAPGSLIHYMIVGQGTVYNPGID